MEVKTFTFMPMRHQERAQARFGYTGLPKRAMFRQMATGPVRCPVSGLARQSSGASRQVTASSRPGSTTRSWMLHDEENVEGLASEHTWRSGQLCHGAGVRLL